MDSRPDHRFSSDEMVHEFEIIQLGIPGLIVPAEVVPMSHDSYLDLPGIRPPGAVARVREATELVDRGESPLPLAAVLVEEAPPLPEGTSDVEALVVVERPPGDEADQLEPEQDHSASAPSASEATPRLQPAYGRPPAPPRAATSARAPRERSLGQRSLPRVPERRPLSSSQSPLVYAIYNSLKKTGYVNMMKVSLSLSVSLSVLHIL